MNILPINPVGVIRLEFSSFGCTRAILHKTLNFGHVILFHNNHPQQRGLSQTWQSQRLSKKKKLIRHYHYSDSCQIRSYQRVR